MAQRIKVRFDRAYRGLAEPLEDDKARIVGVPAGGHVNAGDVVKLGWDLSDAGERVGDPYVVSVISRQYERRTYVRFRPEDGNAIAAECAKRGWPIETFEGNEAAIAHPIGTTVGATLAAVGVGLRSEAGELREQPKD